MSKTKQPLTINQTRDSAAAGLIEYGRQLTRVPANITVNGGGHFTPCLSCGDRATIKNYDGEYCKSCMQFHIVEKMFVNLTKLQGNQR